MSVSKDDVKHIAKLARLKLNDEEIESYTGNLNDILKYIDKLNELELDDVEPLSHPVENTNVFREDELKESTTTDEALKNAPDRTDQYFRVPKVISQSNN
ncbi:MAG: Asp-tRNA(Asn)/Glu-tRNA(Gln) amidotransferase subunit GatC [Melioribacteraceae bacterium]|nr:Asp-tRNA(Asn)/Glu-tRNA(Gln) amidotransferase subunit GatC [Melioribacteraceae bacterium]